MASSRPLDMGDPCTPMAWQQRDLNYHQSGYQDRYGPGAVGGGSSRVGPPSTSDRLSHHTDKSWRMHRDSRDSGQPHLVPYGGSHSQYASGSHSQYASGSHSQYASGPPPAHYPPSRPSYSSGRPPSNPHSPSDTSSTSSSSTSDDESTQQHGDVMPPGPMPPMPHPIYGYAGFHPGYPPVSMGAPGYPGTLKSARSVPALAIATWDGEPCPVHHHHGGPISFPGHHHGPPPPPGYPPMMPPPGPMSLPPPPGSTRRASSIYDMRITSPNPAAIYGTLPVRNIPGDRRSIAGSTILGPAAPGAPPGIPAHLLPPMARPRPLVMGEKGNPEPLPVRNGDKNGGSLPPGMSVKAASSVGHSEEDEKRGNRCRGGACVAWVILAVVCIGILLAVMLRFIL